MRRDVVPRVKGCGWRLRGLWPDRNPLRRAVDRVGAAAGLRVERAQQPAWHQVPAVLLADAPSRGYAGYKPQVRARWTARNGTQGSGDVDAPAGARAGRTVLVWADASGRLTGPPLRHGQVKGQVVLAVLLALAALGWLLAGAGVIAHHRLQRRRLAAWDADWRDDRAAVDRQAMTPGPAAGREPGRKRRTACPAGRRRCPAMNLTDHWLVELTIREQDRLTVAEARLTMDNGAHMFGHGTARRNPADPDVIGIGEEIAVARALSDLAHMLLSTAAAELEDLTHERTQLRL